MIECLVGSYGQKDDSTLHWLSYDLEKNTLQVVKTFEGLVNPSYLALDHTGQNAYIISEVEAGTVSHYKINRKNHDLIHQSDFLTHGGPCYVGLNATEKMVMVANYGGGSLATYACSASGQLTKEIDHIKVSTQSRIHTMRQMGQTAYYMATDIGRSELIVYQMADQGHLKELTKYAWLAVTGPRELVFHPKLPLIYVVHEYQNILSVLEFDALKGKITLKETLTTVESTFTGKNYGAAIALSSEGQTLYLSNRGHESLTVFQLAADGSLTNKQSYPVYGEWPRHFTTIQNTDLLFIANEKTNEVLVMKAGEKLQTITIPQPVCIQPFN